MSNRRTMILVGLVAVTLVTILAVGFGLPMILLLLGGGGAISTTQAGIGGLANEEIERQESTSGCVVGGQATTASQKEYVRTIVGVGKGLGVSKKGQIIAVMVSLAESGLQNYANNGENHFNYDIGTPQGTQFWLDAVQYSQKLPHDAVGSDADSIGLFQQRPSAGWADSGGLVAADSPKKAVNKLLDPKYSSLAFYGGPGGPKNPGLRDIDGWQSMSLGTAAQKVQGSNFPGRYAKWESKARRLVEANSGASKISVGKGGDASGGNKGGNTGGGGNGGGEAVKIDRPVEKSSSHISSHFGNRTSPGGVGSTDHKGMDFGAGMGTPVQAAAKGKVAAAGKTSGFGQWVVINHQFGGKTVSTVYGHVKKGTITVEKGDKVKAGDQIAQVGSEGTSTGPHLHFELWDGGRLSGGEAVDPEEALAGDYTVTGGGGGGGGCSAEDASSTINASGDVKKVIKEGKSQIGVDYSWGGGGPDGPSEGFAQGAGITGFDCSSLMQYMVYQATGETLPRTAAAQYTATQDNQVAKAGDGMGKLQPGDLMFWGSSGSTAHHVAMYIGNGKMIEAPHTGAKVRITEARIDGDYVGATRLDLGGGGKKKGKA